MIDIGVLPIIAELNGSVLITIIPPMFAALLAYFLARKRNLTQEKVQKAKIDAEIQTKALEIVSSVVADVRRELESLKRENADLREKMDDNRKEMENLQRQIKTNEDLISALRTEISSLRSTIMIYENQISRLKNELKKFGQE